MTRELCQACEDEGSGLGCFYQHLRDVTKRVPANESISRVDILLQLASEAKGRGCPYVPNLLVKRASHRLKSK